MSADRRAGSESVEALVARPELLAAIGQHGLGLEVSVRRADGTPVSAAELAQLCAASEPAEVAAQASRRLAMMGVLCAGVTHEARNLLTGILGLTQIAIERARDPKLIAETLQPCEQAARSCVDLLTNYLALGRGQGRRQLLGVADVISPATRLIARQLAARKCVLEVAIPSPQPTLYGNRVELQQVLLNLLINALQAVGEGGTIRVEATTAAVGGRTVVTVTDDGPGVPEDLRELIFRPLFTTKPDGEGTGLGLAWSRELAEAHGGTLTLDASARRGARFVLEIPAHAATAELRST